MAHESCRIFWQRCSNCGAVKTSMHIRGKKEWSKEGKITSRCPANVPIREMCVNCSDEKIDFASNSFNSVGGSIGLSS